MEKIFTIAVREYFGLHNSGTTILQFKYDHEQVSDVITQVRRAVGDYLKTEDGKKALDDNFGCFDWGDVYDIPDSFFAGYGLLKVATPEIDAVVNHDESLVDGN